MLADTHGCSIFPLLMDIGGPSPLQVVPSLTQVCLGHTGKMAECEPRFKPVQSAPQQSFFFSAYLQISASVTTCLKYDP